MNPRVHGYGYCIGDETWSFNIVFTEIIRAMIRNDYDLSLHTGTDEFNRYKKNTPICKKEKGWCFKCGNPDSLEVMPMQKRSFYCYWGEHHIKPSHVQKMNGLDLVFVNSSFSKRMLQESGVTSQIELMPPGVNKAIHVPEKINTDKTKLRYLFVGQQWRRKGLDALAEVWKNFTTQTQNFMELTIKLSPNNINDLAKVQQLFFGMGNVKVIMDSLSKEELAKLYRSHDVFLFPSRSEGFGIPVLEALSCGLLPIATNYGGYTDFCTPSNSLLVPIKGLIPRDDGMDVGEWAEIDCSALYEAIRQSISMDLDAGREARSRSVARYTYDQTVQDMKKLFI